MGQYRGNPVLWNQRSETQKRKEAAAKAAEARLAELEAEVAAAAGIELPGRHRRRPASEPVAEPVIEPAVESIAAPEAEPIIEEQEHKPWR